MPFVKTIALWGKVIGGFAGGDEKGGSRFHVVRGGIVGGGEGGGVSGCVNVHVTKYRGT